MKKRILQLLIESVIPLAGYFLWGWSLYFISLYYLLDLLAREVIVHFKSSARVKYNSNDIRGVWIKSGVMSALLFFVVLVLCYSFFRLYKPEMDFKTESISFWMYKDLGIAQGYILLPFIALVAYLQFKQEFMLKAKYRVLTLREIWNKHLFALFVLLGFIGFSCGVVAIIKGVPELVFVLGLIAITFTFNLLYKD